MLSDICYQQIRDEFWYGSYAGVVVVMDKEKGWVNAGKMCADHGKDLFEWKRAQHTQELFKALLLDLDTGTEVDETSICKFVRTENKSTSDRVISGTYIHRDLVPSLVGWCSPTFQIKVNRIINNFFVQEYKEKLEASEAALSLVNQQNRETQEQLQSALNAWDETTDQLRSTSTELCITSNAFITTAKRLSASRSQFNRWSKENGFAIVRLNDDQNYPYIAIRQQSKGMRSRINKLKQLYPMSEVLYKRDFIPNGINLFNRLKDKGVIKRNNSKFVLNDNFSETELITLLNTMCDS